jgi:hypothetical protein
VADGRDVPVDGREEVWEKRRGLPTGCLCRYFDLHKRWVDVGLNGPADFFSFSDLTSNYQNKC